jgi:hypothetical protein
MTYRSSVSVALALGILVAAALSTVSLIGTASAQQTRAQATANAYYQVFTQAHANTMNAYRQGISQDQFNALIYAETVAWNNYVQAQYAANAEADVLRDLTVQIANVDVTIQNWATYGRNLYNMRDVAAYANDQNYRAAFDNWVQAEAARANMYIGSLQTARAQLQAQVDQGTTVVSEPIETPQPPPQTSCSSLYPSFCGLERSPR